MLLFIYINNYYTNMNPLMFLVPTMLSYAVKSLHEESREKLDTELRRIEKERDDALAELRVDPIQSSLPDNSNSRISPHETPVDYMTSSELHEAKEIRIKKLEQFMKNL